MDGSRKKEDISSNENTLFSFQFHLINLHYSIVGKCGDNQSGANAEKINRANGTNKVDRATRVDRVNRKDGTNRVDVADRADRANRADRAKEVNEVDRADQANRADGANGVDRVEAIDGVDRNRVDIEK